MRHTGYALLGSLATVLLVSSAALAQGVGGASWTPAQSNTTDQSSRLLRAGDSITYRTDAVWDRAQAKGLETYLRGGLRYTHEVNDRGGRLNATGYWATNHPDPTYDRDDDDADGRWEEAEVISGAKTPVAGEMYTSLVQFSRWHGRRVKGVCEWTWDRRKGETVVLSQLSRDLLGEWQATRYTLPYAALVYPRVGTRPALADEIATARCRDQRAGVNQDGFVVTFSRPLSWAELGGRLSVGSGKWTAFEAIGSHPQDDLIWTCGGPVDDVLRLGPCRSMGVRPDGITAAVGYFDELAIAQLRDDLAVVAVDDLQDSLTGLLFGVGGFGVEPPGLSVKDRYWELVLAD